MADGSRSTDFCSGDPTKFWKAATTACLPPRKRLLAGLKQNGWVSSSTSYLQKGCEASCTNEELKLEVDLGEEKHDCNGNTLCSEIPTQNEDESRAVEKVVTVKNKRAIKRRKSLSVLTDCHPARNLQHELSKSFSEVKIQDKIRTNRNSIGPLLDSRWEKESLDPYERAEAARAAAASAAKEAAKARAVALEKAASAAKAALVARNILEAVVLAAQSGTSEIHPSRKSWDSYEQNKVSKDVNCKSGSGSKPSDFPYVLANKDIDSFFEKRRRHKITFNDTSNLIMSRESEKEVGVVSTFVFDPLRGDVVSNSFNDRKHIDNSKTSVSTMHAANTKASSDINKDMEHAQLDKTMSPSCSRSPAFDDEKLARQLHRAMNSSPRISRSKACSDHSRKSETAVTPTGDCSHIKYRQARGGNSAAPRKQIQKRKLQVYRAIGKSDVKMKSMMAINERLNMLQKSAEIQHMMLGSTRADFEHGNDELLLDASSTGLSGSSCTCSKESDELIVSHKINASDRSRLKANDNGCYRSNNDHNMITITDADGPVTIKSSLISRKPKSSRRRQRTGTRKHSPRSQYYRHRVDTLASWTERSKTKAMLEVTPMFMDPKDLDAEDHKSCDEDLGGMTISRLGSTLGDDDYERPMVEGSQENLFCRKLNPIAHRIRDQSQHKEGHKGQKIFRVLANGLSEGSQKRHRSIPSDLTSQIVK